MSLNGITKGTEFEDMMKRLMQAEANGVMMYYALAQLAREQGLEDVAEGFVAAANEEAVHAGFYAVLNGKYPSDFWGLVRAVQKAEENGEAQVKAIADKVRAAGFDEVADQMEIFARQEGGHGGTPAGHARQVSAKGSGHDWQKSLCLPSLRLRVCR